jgi:thiol-disulfide isomerase/thioredoxin
VKRALRIAAPALMLLTAAAEPVEVPPSSPTAVPAGAGFYLAQANGPADFEAALTEAKASGKLAVIVFGADWCHDSRGLAKVLTSDAFKSRFGARFTVTFIDVGVPQTGKGRNLDLVKRLGVKNLKGTPAMFVVSAKGKRINSKKDAVSWRNADSRSEAAILGWFDALLADQAK